MTTETDILIIGRGISGSVLAHKAKEAGLRVHLTGSRPIASLAAMGVMRPSWLPDHMASRFDDVLKWYDKRGWLRVQEAMVSTWKDKNAKRQEHWYVVDNEAPLLPETDPQKLSALPSARLTVHAYTTAPSKKTWGHTGVLSRVSTGAPALKVHMTAPYRHIYVLDSSVNMRIGPSVAATEEDSLKQLAVMANEATKLGMLPLDQTLPHLMPIGGVRLFTEKGPSVEWDADRKIAHMIGMGRIGYSAAPIIADEILAGMA